LTDRPAEKFLLDQFQIKAEKVDLNTPLEAVAKRNPALVLSGISGTANPGVEYYLAKTAEGEKDEKEERVPSVWVEDFWGVAGRNAQLPRSVQPDYICAFDEYSKDMNIKNFARPGIYMDPDRILATGSPAMDELAAEKDALAIKNRVRHELGIGEEEIFVAYVGETPPTDLDNLKIFIDNLNKINLGKKKIRLTTRIHPAVFRDGPLAKYKDEYQDLLRGLKQGESINTMGKFSTDEVAKAADVIISTYSTEGIKAVYRGKISLFMLLPDLGGKGLKDSVGMSTLPVIESGSSIGVFGEEDMPGALKNALDPEYQKVLRAAQEKYHKLDGKNTERVVDLIEEILEKKMK
jgi:hypothetical protein